LYTKKVLTAIKLRKLNNKLLWKSYWVSECLSGWVRSC
jgi:hypothetical protein